jgi:hypothetical protein
MKLVYEALLRTKDKSEVVPPRLREFGGTESGGMRYAFITLVSEGVATDDLALYKFKREARKRKLVLLRVTKVIYEREK